MKQMLKDGELPFLPQEIMANILKRLPVKSLIRFQCVSKDWKNFIKTTSFISDHFHHTSLQNPTLLIERDIPCNLFSFGCDMQIREFDAPFIIDRLSCVRIVGSSNGLLCSWIEGTPPYFLLWNPATREVRPVPIRTGIKGFEGKWISGFGYSTVVDDCKIVRFFASKVYEQVEVYSLSTGLWKEIKFDLEGVTHYSSESLSTNGVIFWHGMKAGSVGKEEYYVILSFDIATEVFTWIPWPALNQSRPKPASYDNKLIVYDNKLALLSHAKIGDVCPSSLIDLWVMEEGTNASRELWSWTKKHTVATFSMCMLPLCIWRNHIVCKVHEMPTGPVADGKLVSVLSLLNPNTYEIKKFTVPTFSAIFNYSESVVSVGERSTMKSLHLHPVSKSIGGI